MERTPSENDMKVRIDSRQILSIALPISISILIPQLNMLVNNIFLGHLSQQAMGDAGVTGIYYMIFAVAGYGMNSALQSVFSGYAGSGETKFFNVVLAQGIRICFQLAVFFILFTLFLGPGIFKMIANPQAYSSEMEFIKIRIWGLPFLYLFQMGNAFLISTLNSRLLLIGFLFQTLSNILLDYLLIFGHAGFPQLGFNGAAYASVISECIGMTAVMIVLFMFGFKRKFKLFSNFSYHQVIHQKIKKVATPLVLQYILSLATWLFFFILIESHGATAKAISNSMRNVIGLAGIFIWAFAGTCNTMVANLIGQEQYNNVIPVIYKIMWWTLGLCIAMVSCLNIFPEAFFNLFGQGEMFNKEGLPVLRIVSLGMLFMSIANVWLNALTGTGQTKVNLLIEIIAIMMYMLYTWYFTKLHYTSLEMAWSNEFIYWVVIFLSSFFYIRSKKWMKNISGLE